MQIVPRIRQNGEIVTKATRPVEGEWRPGPYYLPITGGWLPDGAPINYWQCGIDPFRPTTSAMVEACISAYAESVAMCPGDHWRKLSNNGRERVTTSALYRILRAPNTYQSISDFMLNVVWSLFADGNSYCLALRNDRFEVSELHLCHPSACGVRVAETGEVFYDLGGNPVIDRLLGINRSLETLIVPARDVWHMRLKTPRHPLIGETPLMAAAPQMAAGNAALAQQVQFYLNQARPSFVLTTDIQLTQQQADDLRERWNKQAQGLNTGGTPILGWGLKPNPITVSAVDSQLAEVMKLNDQAIANVFRVPLQILGIGSLPFSSTEALMNFWLATGLNFVFNHLEESLGRFFGLKGVPDEYVEFDFSALLRPLKTDRIEAQIKAIKGGLSTINEERADDEKPKVEGGDQIRVQQQDVPLNFHEEQAKLAKQQQQQQAQQARDSQESQQDSQESPPPPKPRAADVIAAFRSGQSRSLANPG